MNVTPFCLASPKKKSLLGLLLPLVLLLGLTEGCSPLKSSPRDEKHKMELTLHEIQTNLDDLRHDFNCYQTEIQILENKIKHQEKELVGIKQQYFEQHQAKLDQLLKQFEELEKTFSTQTSQQKNIVLDIRQLTGHANETSAALIQYKSRINELENSLLSQQKQFEKLQGTLKNALAKLSHKTIYRVKPGDSLEKIARNHKTTVEEIKKLNNLQNDLIVTDQELKLP